MKNRYLLAVKILVGYNTWWLQYFVVKILGG